ncbi:MAG: hypothetical protein GXO00_00675 [Candidatus Diapherotrites archaeon]|nr:hypothetical protein [Candidatus Diapherotrites archaeon]
MDVGRLMEEGRRFLSKLPRGGRLLVVADDDTDGIIAAHLFAKYYQRKNPYSSVLVDIIRREELPASLQEHPSYTPVILDISPDASISHPSTLYVVDHHPPNSPPSNAVFFNPHLLNIPRASKYNTGFLVFLLFRDDIVRNNDLWKVAVSSFGDSSYDYLKSFFYGIDRRAVELASHVVGSVDREHLPELLSALEESKSIEDFLAHEELLSLKRDFEKQLLELVNNLEEHCFHCEEKLKIILLPPELSRFKSAVSTVYSKRNPDTLVAVGVKEGPLYNFSLRFQRAEEAGVHLGRFASSFSSLWGTKGGGHAPAAGLRIPPEALEELVIELRRLLLSR